MAERNIKTIYRTIEESHQKAEAELLARYPEVNELYDVIDMYFTCVMARLNGLEIKNEKNEGYKLELIVSFMRTNYTIMKLVKASEHVDAITLLRKQLELLSRFVELNKKSKEELEKRTPNVANVQGMGRYYSCMSCVAHSSSCEELRDLLTVENTLPNKYGLSMQPQFSESTIDLLALQFELFIRFGNELLAYQKTHLKNYNEEDDIKIFMCFLNIGATSGLEYFKDFTGVDDGE